MVVEVVLEVERCPGKVAARGRDALALLCQRERLEPAGFLQQPEAAPGPETIRPPTLIGEYGRALARPFPYRCTKVVCVPGIIDIN